MRKFYFFILLIAVTNSNCALFESFDELPMYTEVNSAKLTTNAAQGSSSHKIKDIWPNVDGQSLGVFEMPISFPVLDNDATTNMIYFAGISRIGFADDHTIYPFYERIIIDRDFQPDTRIVEDLSFTYKEDLKFRILEDFEISHSFNKEIDDDETTNIVLTGDDGFEGNCGLIHLTAENPEFAAATSSEYFDIPTDGTAVYVELDYKTDVNFSIGLQAEVNGTEFDQFFVIITPNDSWNKVYIDLAEILQDSDLDAYRLIIGSVYGGDTEAEIRIDNIKLIHF